MVRLLHGGFMMLMAVVLLSGGRVSAETTATRTVCPSGCDHSTIQAAITAANPDDTIQLFTTSSLTESDIIVNKNLTIEGIAETQTAVQAAVTADTATLRVFTILAGSTVTLRNFTIRHGNPDSGNGGGLWVQAGANATLEDMTVANNRASNGGGIANDGVLHLDNLNAAANSAFSLGGGIYSTNQLTLDNSDIQSNHADTFGGGIFNSTAGMLDMRQSVVSLNSADSSGGGIYNRGTLTASQESGTQITLTGNRAGLGGGIYNDVGGTVTIDGLSASANKLVVGSSDDFCGAGIFSAGTTNITNATISAGVAKIAPNFGRGGGLCIRGGEVVLEKVSVRENSADNDGGIHFDDGLLTITRSSIIGNTATQFTGGIVQYAGNSYLTNVTIADNEAGISAGGIHGCGGLMTLANVTVAGNIANADFDSVGDGGGIWYCSGVEKIITLRSSIVAGNIAHGGDYPDCEDLFKSGSFSLIGNTGAAAHRCGLSGLTSGMLVNVSAEFGAAEPEVYPLLASSPAIDAGSCSSALGVPLTVDQRGAPMPVDGNSSGSAECDMGAYEYNSIPLAVTLSEAEIAPKSFNHWLLLTIVLAFCTWVGVTKFSPCNMMNPPASVNDPLNR